MLEQFDFTLLSLHLLNLARMIFPANFVGPSSEDCEVFKAAFCLIFQWLMTLKDMMSEIWKGCCRNSQRNIGMMSSA